VAAQAGRGTTRLHEEEPAGSVKRRAGELGPGGAGRAVKGQVAAGENAGDGRWAALQRTERGSRRKKMRTCS
jgi:hypothetical protein